MPAAGTGQHRQIHPPYSSSSSKLHSSSSPLRHPPSGSTSIESRALSYPPRAKGIHVNCCSAAVRCPPTAIRSPPFARYALHSNAPFVHQFVHQSTLATHEQTVICFDDRHRIKMDELRSEQSKQNISVRSVEMLVLIQQKRYPIPIISRNQAERRRSGRESQTVLAFFSAQKKNFIIMGILQHLTCQLISV